jgi:hypothetical protein
MYVDDILLIAPSVTALQTLLTICENELDYIGMWINVNESVCIIFGLGPRFDEDCANLVTSSGGMVQYGQVVAGISAFILLWPLIWIFLDSVNSRFLSAFNTVFIRVGHSLSEVVILSSLHAKCLASVCS